MDLLAFGAMAYVSLRVPAALLSDGFFELTIDLF